MAKRTGEPEEAFGPALNGLEFPLEPALPMPVEQENLPVPDFETDFHEQADPNPVVLLVGCGELPEEVGHLASTCGFTVQAAVSNEQESASFSWLETVYIVPDYLDLASSCGIDRESFVCVFVDSPVICEDILAQCLATDAKYLGVDGSRESCHTILDSLKALGAPDAELAAIACPMGLNLGAETVAQKSVAIVAELLGAWTGAIKSLGPGLQGLHR